MAQYEIKKCDITIECGATFTMYFVVRDNNNSLVDLTGSTVEAQLREYAEANDYFEFTATHNGSGGRVTLTMPFEDTAAIPYTSGVYDVYITDQNNDREKYLIGDVNIVPAVTKPVAGEIIYLLSFASEDDFPSYGMVRRLYFSHATNHMYRWNGTDYVDIVTDGEAATVEVGDVETLPAGSDATVENVGSLLNAVFDFGIPEGNGIASIEKTGTDVLTDTYTVTFTDPSAEAFDFDVTNGKGIVSIAEVVSGLTHTFTVTFNDGDTFTYTLTDGNGIVSIEKTGATDNVDHYRITFDDGTYFDYDVTNVDTSEFYDKDEVDDLLADKADVGDSYTKDEEDALLADKADSADLGDLATKDTVDWDSDIDNIPSTFPPEGHNHDDRYYTETEMDSLLADKADADDVYTKTEVDDALADKADSDSVYTKTETDTLLLAKAPVILSNASGSIASFTDGSPAPVTALSVNVDAVQDLHGYDNPWPAGGGVNKVNPESILVTLPATITSQTNLYELTASERTTWTATAKVTNNGSIEGRVNIQFVNNGSLIFGTNTVIPVGTTNQLKSVTYDASSLTFDTIRLTVSGASAGYSITVSDIQINEGSAQTQIYPYSNICPISGHTSAMVTRTGKNLFNGVLETGLYSNANFNKGSDLDKRYKSFHLFLKAGTYIFSSSVNLRLLRTVIDGVWETKSIYNATPYTIILTKDGQMGLSFRQEDNNNWDDTNKLQLELGSTATAYESYQGTSVTIDLNGTRYGGVLDILTGELTVNRAIVDLGTLTWEKQTIDSDINFRTRIDDFKLIPDSELAKMVCSAYKTVTSFNITHSFVNGTIASRSPTVPGLRVCDHRYYESTAEEFKTAVSGVQCVYELATPLTVQLSPSQISTLLGTNNIFADTGDTSVEYRADTKRFVQGQIAETLDAVKKAKQIITDVTTEMVAPRNLAEGDYVIVGDDLLKTTATVASGSTLTIDINCVKTTVAEALIALATASE